MTIRLQETFEHLREDVRKVDEPLFNAMFETAADVLGGLAKAFQDYMSKRARVRGNLMPVGPSHI
jgi:hypothetical protein